jgi:type II secretory pathway component GspD/PulD (secretin)
MPYIGKLLFGRAQRSSNRTTLLIFLTGYLVD